MSDPGTKWSNALQTWAIPDEILNQAPTSPWVHPPKMFRASDDDPADTPSMQAAAALLGTGGSLLDVGCGGGRSSLPLGSALITPVIGVDEQQAMLDQFTEAAAARGIPSQTVLGLWPDVSPRTPVADVVVCHHVVYNVAPIDQFVEALSRHARRGVVVELPDRHPTSPFNGLWKRFWDLDRPTEPSADLFVEVVRVAGFEPTRIDSVRPPRKAQLDADEFVAFVRQRLCLGADRDADIRATLATDFGEDQTSIVTVSWTT
jgi:SAM-dependent methyltransferase